MLYTSIESFFFFLVPKNLCRDDGETSIILTAERAIKIPTHTFVQLSKGDFLSLMKFSQP